jgi:hypothetical protein
MPLDAPLHEIVLRNEWREEYRKNRYLEHLADEELRQRQRDISQNVYSFTAAGEMVVGQRHQQWDILMAHVLTEAQIRGTQLEHPLRVAGYHKQKRASEVWAATPKPQKPFLVKYGRRIHLEPMLNEGLLRLSPASKYRDALNAAVRDTELEFTEEWHGASVSAPENGDYSIPPQLWTPLPMIGNVKARLTADADYYTACFSNRFDPRLFDDFDADSCLLIMDPSAFVQKLQTSANEHLPNWRFSNANVRYRDPFHPLLDNSIVYAKHFRYAYQDEFRCAWQPPAACGDLEHLTITMGQLEDVATLLLL